MQRVGSLSRERAANRKQGKVGSLTWEGAWARVERPGSTVPAEVLEACSIRPELSTSESTRSIFRCTDASRRSHGGDGS